MARTLARREVDEQGGRGLLGRCCLVCGADETEVGPDLGAFSICPVWDDDVGAPVGDEWELRTCLDEQLGWEAA